MNTLGDTIKRIRIKRGMSRQALADASDLAPNHVALIECGKSVPRLATLVAIGHAIKISPERLASLAIDDLEGK